MLGDRSISQLKLNNSLCAKTQRVPAVPVNISTSDTFNMSEALAVSLSEVERTTELWSQFCTGWELNATCDEYFVHNNLTQTQGIPGLASGRIAGNAFTRILAPTLVQT